MKRLLISALSLSGALTASYQCEDYTLPATPTTTKVPDPAHLILVVDRSGSMSYEMKDMRAVLEKVLTIGEYKNPDLYCTLISYSTQGDTTTHFSHVAITEVMKAGSAQVESIRQLQATGLTCISGGLAAARSQVRAGEVTLISLHSDGYANHPSPSAEIKNLQREAEALAAMPNVTVNGIAHNIYSDFNLLNTVASTVRGTAIMAKSAGEVYNTLEASTKNLASGNTVATVIPGVSGQGRGTVLVIIRGDAATGEGKVLGGPVEKDLTIRGLPTDPALVRVVRVFDGKALLKGSEMAPPPAEENDHEAAMALTYYLLGKKQIGRARDILRGTRERTLIKNHGRAMTASQVQAFTLTSLDAALNFSKYFDPSVYQAVDFDALGRRTPVSTIFLALNAVARDVLISMKSLNDGYTRRSMKRLPGARQPDGSIIAPVTKLVRKKDVEFVQVTGIEPNTTTAVMNITVSIPANLVDYQTNAVIPEVAGIELDRLSDFRSYTVVAEGDVKIPKLTLKFKTKQAFNVMAGFLEGTIPFSPTTEYTLDLTDRSLLSAEAADGLDQEELKAATLELPALNILISFFKAALKSPDAATTYTAEQVAALKAVHLSEKLYHSAPTCTAHPDLDAAINKGEVDSYNKYSVETGTPGLLTLDRLTSANAFLQRWFTVEIGGTKLDKPTIVDAITQGAKLEVKTPGARMKVTAADDLVLPFYKALLIDGSDTTVLKGVDCISDALDSLLRITRRLDTTGLDAGFVIGQAQSVLQNYKEELQYRTTIPFAMYVGSTGSLPDSWGGVTGPLDAEEFAKLNPEVTLTKSEKEDSLFYGLSNGLIVTISAVSERFTTEAGMKATAAAQAA